MKLHRLSLVALMTLLIFTGDSFAQEKMFGNGRLLRRIRDNFNGGRIKDAKSALTPKSGSNSKLKIPTPAKPSTNAPKFTNSGVRPPSRSKTPTLAAPKLAAPKLATPKPSATLVAPKIDSRINSRVESRNTPPIVESTRRESRVTRSGKKQTIGFGMVLESNGKNFVITQVYPKGNAKESGLKVGDKVIKAAGIELNSIEEFNQITDVLREGDQIEIEYRRGNKNDKSFIMLGEGPDLEEQTVQLIEPAVTSDSGKNKPGLSAPGSNFEFVPPQANRAPSIVSQPRRNYKPSQTYRPSQTQLLQPAAPQKSAGRVEYEKQLAQQRREIELLNAELRLLRQRATVPENTKLQGNSILQVPDLQGPGR